MWDFPLFPEQASTMAREVDALYVFELLFAGFFTILICVLIVTFAVRYRQQANVDRSNPPVANRLMEVVWIVVPLILCMVMFAWGAIVFFRIYQPPGNALDIAVVAKQWMWKTQHSEGRSEINELHVPLGRPVKLNMISQDVIHSFYVPAFRVKQDVLPGRYTSLWFEPVRVGRYHLYCASIAARTIRRWEAGSPSWSRPIFRAGFRRAARSVDGRGRRAPVRPAPLRRLPPRQSNGIGASAGGRLRASGSDSGGP